MSGALDRLELSGPLFIKALGCIAPDEIWAFVAACWQVSVAGRPFTA